MTYYILMTAREKEIRWNAWTRDPRVHYSAKDWVSPVQTAVLGQDTYKLQALLGD